MIDEQMIKFLQNASEVELFFLIEECGSFKHKMKHDMAHNKIDKGAFPVIEEDIKNVSEIQNFAAKELIRFGVDSETSKDSENGDYWKWHKHFSNWRDSLSEETWQIIKNKLENHQSFEEYLPKTNWREINLKN